MTTTKEEIAETLIGTHFIGGVGGIYLSSRAPGGIILTGMACLWFYQAVGKIDSY